MDTEDRKRKSPGLKRKNKYRRRQSIIKAMTTAHRKGCKSGRGVSGGMRGSLDTSAKGRRNVFKRLGRWSLQSRSVFGTGAIKGLQQMSKATGKQDR